MLKNAGRHSRVLAMLISNLKIFLGLDELVERSRDQSVSDYIVMFFRFVTSGEIRKRSEFFEPFITGLTNGTVDKVLLYLGPLFLCQRTLSLAVILLGSG